jgi:hypothetical protein
MSYDCSINPNIKALVHAIIKLKNPKSKKKVLTSLTTNKLRKIMNTKH